MASVLSADAGERASLSTFRSVGAMLALSLIHIYTTAPSGDAGAGGETGGGGTPEG